MRKLLWIGDNVDILDATILNVQCENGVRLSGEVVDQTWCAVDPNQFSDEHRRHQPLQASEDAPSDLVSPTNLIRYGKPFPSAI